MKRCTAVLVFWTALFAMQFVQAAEVLDQQWTDTTRADTSTGFDADYGFSAQTFTVGISGTLAHVEVYVSDQGDINVHGDLQIAIWNTVSGVPNAPLATTTISEDAFPGFSQKMWVNADFGSAALMVSSGDQLAIVLSSLGDKNYSFYGTLDSPFYVGGSAFQFSGGTWNQDFFDRHYSELFKTYVIIPELASSTLFVAGGMGLLIWARRRK